MHTKQSFWFGHPHLFWNWIVEQRNPHRISHWHLPRFVSLESAIRKGSHGVDPRFAGTIDEATINPACNLIHLKGSRLSFWYNWWNLFFGKRIPTCSLGLFGLWPVFLSYAALWKGINLFPSHCLSYISSHFSISMWCISMGHPLSLAITISDVTIWPKNARRAVLLFMDARPSKPRMKSRLRTLGLGRFWPAIM